MIVDRIEPPLDIGMGEGIEAEMMECLLSSSVNEDAEDPFLSFWCDCPLPIIRRLVPFPSCV